MHTRPLCAWCTGRCLVATHGNLSNASSAFAVGVTWARSPPLGGPRCLGCAFANSARLGRRPIVSEARRHAQALRAVEGRELQPPAEPLADSESCGCVVRRRIRHGKAGSILENYQASRIGRRPAPNNVRHLGSVSCAPDRSTTQQVCSRRCADTTRGANRGDGRCLFRRDHSGTLKISAPVSSRTEMYRVVPVWVGVFGSSRAMAIARALAACANRNSPPLSSRRSESPWTM
jgi:hypothetical protein